MGIRRARKKVELTADHCAEALEKELLIGSDTTDNGERKTFTYQPSTGLYTVRVAGVISCFGIKPGLDYLLEKYNSL